MIIYLAIIGYVVIYNYRENGMVFFFGALGLVIGIILYFSVKEFRPHVIGISVDLGLIVGASIANLVGSKNESEPKNL